MRQLFLEEWKKYIHARSVRIGFLLFLSAGIFTAVTTDFTAYMALFLEYNCWSYMGPMLFSFIVAGQAAGEYQNGRAAKAASESKREQYFAAKVMGLFSLSAFFYLANTAVLSLLCYIKNGAGSGYFPYYPLQAAVFLLCRILIYWVYTAVFFLIGVLVRRRFWAFTLSCGAVILETALWLAQLLKNGQPVTGGPLAALMQSGKYIGMANVLSYDYFILFVPSVYSGCFALIIAYHVFRRGKLHIESRKKPFRNFVKKLLRLAVITVLFLSCGQTGICAEGNSVPLTDQQSVKNAGELRLIFGDRNLDDRDAFVLFLMAEGFTEKEQEDFFKGVENLTSVLMSIPPFDEFADVTKIYAMGTISAESGIKGDQADTWEQAKQDSRDTFFGTAFWGSGSDWRVEIPPEGTLKMYQLRTQFLPAADFCGIIMNSNLHRGTAYYAQSTGNVFLATLNPEVLPHELGHMIANLADEYDRKQYSNNAYEAPNMTREPDPKKVKWANYIGMDDISVYESVYNKGWYHPSMTCIMRSEDTGRFCKVCEAALRGYLCRYCRTGRLLFDACGEQIPESHTGTDMRKYFSVRKMYSALESSQIPEELLSLQYYDDNGRRIDGPPGKAGHYSVEAEFLGYQTENVTYEPCILTVSYEIKPNPAKKFWLSMAPLFFGTAVWIVWLKLRAPRSSNVFS